jgi:hypothetical protein
LNTSMNDDQRSYRVITALLAALLENYCCRCPLD